MTRGPFPAVLRARCHSGPTPCPPPHGESHLTLLAPSGAGGSLDRCRRRCPLSRDPRDDSAIVTDNAARHRGCPHRTAHCSSGAAGIDGLSPPMPLASSVTAVPRRPSRLSCAHLGQYRHEAPTMGRSSPQAPRVCRHGARSSLSHRPGLQTGPIRQRAVYRKVARDRTAVNRYARDLPADRWDRLLFDHALVGLGLGVGLLVLLFGWPLALVAAGVHVAYYLLGSGAINAIGHRWGRRPFDNLATNNQWLAWLVVGEGLHNNHHAATTSSRFSLARGEVDPGWWSIWLLVRLRWATLRETSIVPRVRTSP